MNSHEAKLWSERFLIFLQGALVIQHLTKNKEIHILVKDKLGVYIKIYRRSQV